MASKTATAKALTAEEEMRAQLMAEMQMEDDPAAVIDGLLAQQGFDAEQAKFKVYRIVDDGRKPDAFLFECVPDDFNQEEIGKKYGTGTYRLRVYAKTSENPQGVIVRAPKFTVEMPPGYTPPVAAVTVAQPVGVQSPAEMAAMVAQAVASTLAPVLQTIASKPETNTLDEMAKLAGVMKMLMPAAPAVATAHAPTLMEQLALMTQLQTFMKSMNPSEGGKTDLTTLFAEKGLDALTGMLAMAQQQKAAQVGQPALPPPQPETAQVMANPVEPEPNESDDEMKILWKAALKAACKSAKQNSPAADFAETWFDMVPDEILDQLSDDPDWFKKVCEVYPECSMYEAWFVQLRTTMVEWYNAPADGVDNPENPGDTVSTNNDTTVTDGDSNPGGTATPA